MIEEKKEGAQLLKEVLDGNILQMLSKNALVQFKLGIAGAGLASMFLAEGSYQAIFADVKNESKYHNFKLWDYQYNGTYAKACIESCDFPGQYWNTIPSLHNYNDVITLGSVVQYFILELAPSSTSMISFQDVTGADPYFQIYNVDPQVNYLKYGFPSPGFNVFSVSVIG